MTLLAIAKTYAILCAAVGVFMFLMTLSNTIWLFFTTFIEPVTSGPHVSVLIPARNEAERIKPCIESLLDQNYENYDITIYDDDSSDDTGRIIDGYAREYAGFVRVIHGEKLEAGWYGKPHAMQRLSEYAEGTYLLFTDADTVHSPDSIGAAVALAMHHNADLVSGYIRHEVRTFGEAEVVPSIYILTMIAMPLWLIHCTRQASISHAIGQFMLFKASSYKKIGGYGCVRDQVSEDVRIARHLKKNGGKLIFADLKQFVSCRMYEDYKSAIAGISKNVFDYFNKNFFILLAGTVAVPLFFFLPFIGLFFVPPGFESIQPFFHVSAIFTLYSWALVTAERMLPWYVPFIFPLILVNALSSAWRAFKTFLDGKAIDWKGRMVK